MLANNCRIAGGSPSPGGPMEEFFAIPGISGKIRLKIRKPVGTANVIIRYKLTPWVEGDDVSAGTLVADINDDTPYHGPNNYYEVSGLADGTAYYFKAFLGLAQTPGADETVCKAGGLMAEYTMDSVSGSVVNDTSGNNNNSTASDGLAFMPGKVGDEFVGNGSSSFFFVPLAAGSIRAVSLILTYNAQPVGTQQIFDSGIAGSGYGTRSFGFTGSLFRIGTVIPAPGYGSYVEFSLPALAGNKKHMAINLPASTNNSADQIKVYESLNGIAVNYYNQA